MSESKLVKTTSLSAKDTLPQQKQKPLEADDAPTIMEPSRVQTQPHTDSAQGKRNVNLTPPKPPAPGKSRAGMLAPPKPKRPPPPSSITEALKKVAEDDITHLEKPLKPGLLPPLSAILNAAKKTAPPAPLSLKTDDADKDTKPSSFPAFAQEDFQPPSAVMAEDASAKAPEPVPSPEEEPAPLSSIRVDASLGPVIIREKPDVSSLPTPSRSVGALDATSVIMIPRSRPGRGKGILGGVLLLSVLGGVGYLLLWPDSPAQEEVRAALLPPTTQADASSLPAPDTRLAPAPASPEEEAEPETIAASAPTETETLATVPSTRLEILTSPAGARVSLNGQPLGETPLMEEIPYGEKEAVLRIEKDGFETLELPFTPNAPYRTTISLDQESKKAVKSRAKARGSKKGKKSPAKTTSTKKTNSTRTKEGKGNKKATFNPYRKKR